VTQSTDAGSSPLLGLKLASI